MQQNSNFEEFSELPRRVSILPIDNRQLANSKSAYEKNKCQTIRKFFFYLLSRLSSNKLADQNKNRRYVSKIGINFTESPQFLLRERESAIFFYSYPHITFRYILMLSAMMNMQFYFYMHKNCLIIDVCCI
jgi:hypothetical protein